jgi:hypothetical protein
MSGVGQIVALLRERGPLMRIEIAKALEWSNTKTNEFLAEARGLRLVAMVGKIDRGRMVFGAVQTTNWPRLVKNDTGSVLSGSSGAVSQRGDGLEGGEEHGVCRDDYALPRK